MALVIDKFILADKYIRDDKIEYDTVIFLKNNLFFNKMMLCRFTSTEKDLPLFEIKRRLETGTSVNNKAVINAIRTGYAFVYNTYFENLTMQNIDDFTFQDYRIRGIL